MARVKRGLLTQKKHKKLRKAVKGFRTTRRKSVKLARQAYMKSLTYAYRDRRVKKRTFRGLWITKINGALQSFGIGYSKFIHNLKEKNIDIDRKILAQLAYQEPDLFKAVVEKVK